MTTPLVAVGMPVYNAEAFIEETLHSLLGQTFRDLEIIICDNASTDSTETICRRLAGADDRVRYLRNESNLGIVPNFNRAFELSNSKFFRWCAFDDPVSPEYIGSCLEVFETHPKVVLVAPRPNLIESDGRGVPFRSEINAHVTSYGEIIPTTSPPSNLGSELPHRRFRSALLQLGGSNHAQFFYGLIRSNALTRTSLMGPYVGSERVMLAELALMGKMVELRERMFHRRHHPGHFGGLSPREAAKRMNPDQSHVMFPLGRQVREYLRIVSRAEISAGQKLLCTLAVGEKLLSGGVKLTKRKISQAKSSRPVSLEVPR